MRTRGQVTEREKLSRHHNVQQLLILDDLIACAGGRQWVYPRALRFLPPGLSTESGS